MLITGWGPPGPAPSIGQGSEGWLQIYCQKIKQLFEKSFWVEIIIHVFSKQVSYKLRFSIWGLGIKMYNVYCMSNKLSC